MISQAIEYFAENIDSLVGAFAWTIYHWPILVWLILWKDPLSPMSRSRIYERRTIHVKPEEDIETFKVRRFYIDKQRY